MCCVKENLKTNNNKIIFAKKKGSTKFAERAKQFLFLSWYYKKKKDILYLKANILIRG